MKDTVLRHISDFVEVQESEIIRSADKKILGYNACVVTSHSSHFAGGTAQSQQEATRIAIAEGLERSTIKKLSKEKYSELLLNEYPTSCGFAAGFSSSSTAFRAVCEAVERWAWEKWIDDNCAMQKSPGPRLPSDLVIEMLKVFSSTLYFQKELILLTNGKAKKLLFSVCLGLTDKGIFPGSRVSGVHDDPWSHAILEAWRNLLIFNSIYTKGINHLNFLERRILYFGEHRTEAIAHITRATQEWPMGPTLRILKPVVEGPEFYIYRALCNGFKGWHHGPDSRFIY